MRRNMEYWYRYLSLQQKKVQVNWGGKQYEMELADEAGFFAVLIPEKKDQRIYV